MVLEQLFISETFEKKRKKKQQKQHSDVFAEMEYAVKKREYILWSVKIYQQGHLHQYYN